MPDQLNQHDMETRAGSDPGLINFIPRNAPDAVNGAESLAATKALCFGARTRRAKPGITAPRFRPTFTRTPILAALLGLLLQGMMAYGGLEFTLATARPAAEQGDAHALYFLAKAYSKGDGVPLDYAKAAEYMRQSAEKGYAFAQNDLGAMYAKGLGVKQDHETAAKWYHRAAEKGDALAQYSLGQIYFSGRGVSRDIPQSLLWYQRAAKGKQPDAMLALGKIYLEGSVGVAVDYKASRQWFEQAVKAGRVDALNSLGFIYEHGGPGLEKNPVQAVKCFQEAAAQGDARAQMNLGRMYQAGAGVSRDYLAAYKWFWLASQNGERIADHYVLELEGANPLGKQFLSPDQIAEARRWANAWITDRKMPGR